MAKPLTPGQVPDAVRKEHNRRLRMLRKGAYLAAVRGKAYLQKITPVDTGNAKNAWRVIRSTKWACRLVNDAPYIGVIEAGARPHGVSHEGQQSIAGWVRRHNPGLEEKQVWEIVYGIVWKLINRGQPPTWFIRKSLPMLEKFAAIEIGKLLAKSKLPASIRDIVQVVEL